MLSFLNLSCWLYRSVTFPRFVRSGIRAFSSLSGWLPMRFLSCSNPGEILMCRRLCLILCTQISLTELYFKKKEKSLTQQLTFVPFVTFLFCSDLFSFPSKCPSHMMQYEDTRNRLVPSSMLGCATGGEEDQIF